MSEHQDHGSARKGLTTGESDEVPEVYALERAGAGWNLRRRDFLGAASGVALGGAALPALGASREQGAGKTAERLSKSCETARAHTGGINALVISPDGKLLASGSDDMTVKLWSLPDGALRATLPGQTGSVDAVAISPDGKLLVSGSQDKKIKLWALPDGALRATLTEYTDPDVGRGATPWHTGSVDAVAISPDGKLLVSGSSDKTIKLWSLPDGALQGTLTGTASIKVVAITADSKLLTSAGEDKTIKLWSLPDGALRSTLTGHTAPVTAVAIAADGKLLASGSWNETIKLWSLTDGAQGKPIKRRSLDWMLGKAIKPWSHDWELRSTLTGHTAPVTAVAITDDGKLLVSGSQDKKIKLWALPNGAQKMCLMDVEASTSDAKGVKYTAKDEYGRTVSYTLPCGSPIPQGATCVCNCVPGSIVTRQQCNCVPVSYYYPN